MADLMALLEAAVVLLLELTSPTRQSSLHGMSWGDEERAGIEVFREPNICGYQNRRHYDKSHGPQINQIYAMRTFTTSCEKWR
jgi:hypothetical protein